MNRITSFFALLLFVLVLSSCGKQAGLAPEGSGYVSGDTYDVLEENPFVNVSDEPISTFSIDADGASYANTRRFLTQDNAIPPKGAVRTEELINYFELDYPYTNTGHPIALNGEVSSCPWNEANRLVRIGIKGKPLTEQEMGASNFVLLIDVSGSMDAPDKLDILKEGFNLFVDQMADDDRIAIVSYAGSDKIKLKSTSGREKDKIRRAIDRLGAGGGTNGAQGIVTAYEIAQENFVTGGNNRIILGTDGDFNIGVTDHDELIALIEEKRESGVFLTALGVGRGNLNDATIEQLANHGNGTYEYIDNVEQLRKVFLYDYQKFYTVAKDVKVQVEFNPENVLSYRLIGYENRLLETNDFEDDEVDAGEIGGNQNITAVYEIVPTYEPQYETQPSFTIDFRYKLPNSETSVPLDLDIFDEGTEFDQSSSWMRFVAGCVGFSMLITDSDYIGTTTYAKVYQWISNGSQFDPHNFKSEFRGLVTRADALD